MAGLHFTRYKLQPTTSKTCCVAQCLHTAQYTKYVHYTVWKNLPSTVHTVSVHPEHNGENYTLSTVFSVHPVHRGEYCMQGIGCLSVCTVYTVHPCTRLFIQYKQYCIFIENNLLNLVYNTTFCLSRYIAENSL